MTDSASITAAMSAIDFQAAESGVPEWIHLLPAPKGGKIETQDKRGPYFIESQQAIIDRTMATMGKVPVDINHSIHKAAKDGQPSPAVGWVTELEVRDTGIWGKVDWSAQGARLLKSKAYRGISPVITHNKAKTVSGITAVSLINTPNLRGLTALHSEDTDMPFSEKLAKLFGLDASATEDEIAQAAQSAIDGAGKTEAAQGVQGELDKIAPVVGLEAGATVDEIVEAAQSKVAAADGEIEALQTSLKDVSKQLNTLKEDSARTKAETFFDAELAKGRVGLNANNRDRYVAMHMKDAAQTEEIVNDFPIITGEMPAPALQKSESFEGKDPEQIALQAQELITKRAEQGQTLDIATAITMIEEGQA